MNCVFKSYGYVPPNHLCIGCTPLRRILSTVGYSEAQAKEGSRTILNAFNMINYADTMRDEGVLARAKARLLILFSSRTLPVELKRVLVRVNKETARLEENDADAETYIESVSGLGGDIFESLGGTCIQRKMLRDIGMRMAGAVLVDDMVRDFDRDKINGAYNPLNNEEAEGRARIRETYVTRFRETVDPILGCGDYRGKGSLTREWIEDMCMYHCIGYCCP